MKSELDLAFVNFIVARYKIAPTIPNVKRNPKTLPTLEKLGEKSTLKISNMRGPIDYLLHLFNNKTEILHLAGILMKNFLEGSTLSLRLW